MEKEPFKNSKIEIDFNQTSPNYYWNKVSELISAFRVPFAISKEYIEQNPRIKGKVNIGDIDTKYPDWPKEPKLAFELFKNFYAYKFFLLTIHDFLKAVGNWNQRAIEDELKKINLFIDETKKFNFREAAEQKEHLRNQYQKYILLANDYYLTHSIENDWSYNLEMIFAKFFLFKDLLENKTNITVSDKTTIDKYPPKPTLKEDIKHMKELLFPLSGFWNRNRIMEKPEFERLTFYLEYLIKNNTLPPDKKTFKTTCVSNEFIRRTIYNIYKNLGKKNRIEFINLIHLLRQFNNTETTTTASKFSIYSGNYENDIKKMITYE